MGADINGFMGSNIDSLKGGFSYKIELKGEGIETTEFDDKILSYASEILGMPMSGDVFPLNKEGHKITTEDEIKLKEDQIKEAEKIQVLEVNSEEVNFEQLVLAKDRDKLKTDIDTVMEKLQESILNDDTGIFPAIKEKLQGAWGRDYLAYAPILGFSNDLYQLLKGWNKDDWSLEETSGLLMDIAIAVRKLEKPLEKKESIEKEEKPDSSKSVSLLGTKLDEVRGPNHSINRGSDWVKNLKFFGVDEKKDLMAGPSASTANVLKFLRLTGNQTKRRQKQL